MQFNYQPTLMSASALPVFDRATKRYPHLRNRNLDAKTFCQNLCRLSAVPTISPLEYSSIAKVANGGIWPVPGRVYTLKDWVRDGSFSAVPGQEVSEYVYTTMQGFRPNTELPHCESARGFSSGFMCDEPFGIQPRTWNTTYLTFGRIGNRYYFIGALSKA